MRSTGRAGVSGGQDLAGACLGPANCLVPKILRQPKGLPKLLDGMIDKDMQAEVGNLANLKTHLGAH